MSDEPLNRRAGPRGRPENLLDWREGLERANATPRCGAKNRAGQPCGSPAMRNGRCYRHGGTSTGPKTPEGKARSANARWKHGARSRRMARARKQAQALLDMLTQ